jgi:hypothetical protein
MKKWEKKLVDEVFDCIKKSMKQGLSVTDSSKIAGVNRFWMAQHLSEEQKREIQEIKALFSTGYTSKYQLDSGKRIY